MKNEKLLAAVSTMIGAIVGAGIFGLPYVISRAGFLIGMLELAALSGVVLMLHLLYGEIVLRTQEPRRLIGYAEKYLGAYAKRFTMFSVIFGGYGGLLAYLIIGGEFAASVFEPMFGGSPLAYALMFYLVLSLMVCAKVKTVGRLEMGMTFFLLLTMGLIIGFGLPKINLQNLASINPGQSFLPYGVILFAMAGSAAVPVIRDMLAGEETKIKKAIVWGTLIPAVLYALFVFVAVGVSGTNTTQEALAGLSASTLGSGVILLGSIFGLFAVATSFLIFGEYLEQTFNYDLKINKTLSYVLVVGVPLIAFLSGIRSFVGVIGFLGAVVGGIEGILIVLMAARARILGNRRPEYSLHLPSVFTCGIIGLFALGIAYEVFFYLKMW